jgi:hypothetical protein
VYREGATTNAGLFPNLDATYLICTAYQPQYNGPGERNGRVTVIGRGKGGHFTYMLIYWCCI